MKIRFKSIKAIILLSLLPVALVGMILLTVLSYVSSKNIVERELDQKMDNQLNANVLGIQKSLLKHGEVALALAKTAETSGKILSKDNYSSMLKGFVSTNVETFGAGVWFEPNQYKPEMKYFGPYTYRDGDKIIYTDDYSNEQYNYFQYDWYQSGKKAGYVDNTICWSPPYYDEIAKTTMVTATVPFYDNNKKFVGCVTSDINIDSLQNMISGIKIGKSGDAFLIDRDGTYLATKDKSKIMKTKISEEKNKDLAAISSQLFKNPHGKTTYKEGNTNYIVYYEAIPENNWVIGLRISEKELLEPVNTLLLYLLAAIAIIAALFIFVVLLFERYLNKNINSVNGLAFAISNGDLTQTLNINTKDELGQMGNHLNKMIKVLRDIVKNVDESAENVVSTSEELTASAEETQSASEQIASSMQDVSAGAEKQVVLASQTRDNIHEISKNMEDVSNSLECIAQSSSGSYEKAMRGSSSIGNVIEQMNLIDKKVSASSDSVNILGNKSNEIGQIISVIKGIAEQTNLLALNAAIEAARAGEQGKGFAVVADEVRKLAEQSASASNKISLLINEIQGCIVSAINSMKDGNNAVKEGISIVDNAGVSFKDILASIDDVAVKIYESTQIINSTLTATQTMVSSIDEITNITDKLAQNIQTVAAASEEQTAIMKEVSGAAEALSHMSVELKKSLEMFKL